MNERADVEKEGLFRVPGRHTLTVELKAAYERGQPFSADADAYVVADLLSQFFRELPEPLMTHALYASLLDAASATDEQQRAVQLRQTLQALAKPNFATLKCLIFFLALVASYSEANRMTSKNLSLVFGASLLNPPPNLAYDVATIKRQCSLVEFIIDFSDAVFVDD
jgi:hypothetical protein